MQGELADVGNGNLTGTTDPLFTNPAIGDFTIKAGSPAINAGSNALYTGNINADKDLAGNSRLFGYTIDMGAYEALSQPQIISNLSAISKTYGDADFEPGATSTSGLTLSYSSADNSVAEAYQDVSDGNKWKIKIKKVGEVNLTASQTGGNGYDPATDVAFKLSISPKVVSVVINPGANLIKTYDGGTQGSISATDLSFATNSIINNDVVNVSSNSTVISYDTKDAGTGKTITLPYQALSLTGANAGNYSIANTAYLTANIGIINPAPLTITANNQFKTYDGTVYNGGNGLSYDKFAGNDGVSSLQGTLSYTGTAQGAKDVGNYNIIPAGLTSSNYIIVFKAGALNISLNNANNLSFNTQIPSSTLNRTYGDTDVNGSGVASSGLQPNYLSSNANVATVDATGQIKLTGTGNTTITVSQAGNNNYAAATAIRFNINVNKKMLTVKAKDQSKTFDNIAYTGGNGLDYTGFITGEDKTAVSETGLTYSGTAQGAVNVGAYSITPAGLSANNYSFDYQNGNLTILQVGNNVLTFNHQTTGSTQNIIYGQSTLDVSAKASSGLKVNYTSSNPTIAAVNTNGQLTVLKAGITVLKATQPGDKNISPAAEISFTLVVNKKVLTITANNANKTYDGVAYTGGSGVLYSGFENNENEQNLQGTLSYTGTAQGAKDVNSYFISPGGYVSDNYVITYVDGSLTITKAILSITADAKNKTYGDANPTLTYTSTGLIGTDAITGTLLRNTGENVGSYVINVGSLTAGSNYTINYTGVNLQINKATLNVIADNKQVCQGSSLPTFSTSYAGFKFNDTESSLSTKASVATPVNNNSAAGNYILTPSGGFSANYNLNYVNGSLTIYAKPVPTISNNKSNSVSKGETLVLTAAGGSSYVWSNASGIIAGQQTANLTIRPTSTTTYTVTASNSNSNGCSESASYTVEVRDDFQAVKANNILTPNGDGINDFWVIENIDMYPNNVVTIFDKAGRVIYTQKGYKNTWDGTVNGSPLSENTYYYIIDFGTDKIKQKGFITLIRQQ